jgi:hypothetical protein
MQSASASDWTLSVAMAASGLHPSIWSTLTRTRSPSSISDLPDMPSLEEALSIGKVIAMEHEPGHDLLELQDLEDDIRKSFEPGGLLDPLSGSRRFRCFISLHLAVEAGRSERDESQRTSTLRELALKEVSSVIQNEDLVRRRLLDRF